MRRTIISVAVAGALVLAACGTEASGSANGKYLRYAYDPGSTLDYEVETVLMADISADGAMAGLMDMSMNIGLEQAVTYSIAEGPTPGTIELTLHQTILNGSGSVTGLGTTEFLSPADLGVTEMEVRMVIDELGNLVEAEFDGQAVPLELLGGVGGFGTDAFTQPQHSGPAFPDFPVDVGDVWKTDDEFSGFGFDMRQKGEHELVEVSELEGRRVMVIESEVTMEKMTMTLSDILAMAAADFTADATAQAETDAAMEMFETTGADMKMVIEETVMTMTTWFDDAEGVVVRSDLDFPMVMVIEMSGIPDLPGGISLTMQMDLAQTSVLAG